EGKPDELHQTGEDGGRTAHEVLVAHRGDPRGIARNRRARHLGGGTPLRSRRSEIVGPPRQFRHGQRDVATVTNDEENLGWGKVRHQGVELSPMARRFLAAIRLAAPLRIKLENCGEYRARTLTSAAPFYHVGRLQPEFGQAGPAGENLVERRTL